jgi:hypothetical protein
MSKDGFIPHNGCTVASGACFTESACLGNCQKGTKTFMVIEADRLTKLKAEDIAARDSYKPTGVVLMRKDGARCIVEQSAVRWIGKDEFWDLMHPDSVRNVANWKGA